MKTGVRAHKDYLETLRSEMKLLGEKFENGTIQDYERDRMEILGQEIRMKEQELMGL